MSKRTTSTRKATTKPARLIRNGEPCNVVEKGNPRRLSDARCAWRKMTPAQRAEFLAFIEEAGLKVEGQ